MIADEADLLGCLPRKLQWGCLAFVIIASLAVLIYLEVT